MCVFQEAEGFHCMRMTWAMKVSMWPHRAYSMYMELEQSRVSGSTLTLMMWIWRVPFEQMQSFKFRCISKFQRWKPYQTVHCENLLLELPWKQTMERDRFFFSKRLLTFQFLSLILIEHHHWLRKTSQNVGLSLRSIWNPISIKTRSPIDLSNRAVQRPWRQFWLRDTVLEFLGLFRWAIGHQMCGTGWEN